MAFRCFRELARHGRRFPSVLPRREICVSARELVRLISVQSEAPIPRGSLPRTGLFQLCRGPLGLRDIHSSVQVLDHVTIAVPSMGDSVSEGSVATILKSPGDTVSEDEVVAQIETDKVTIDVRYTGSKPGKIMEVLVKEEDTVVVGQAVAKVEEGNAEIPVEQPTTGPEPTSTPAPDSPPPKKEAPPAQQQVSTEAQDSTPPSPSRRPETRVKMTRLRKRVAERLKGAQNTYAMLSTFNEIDMTNIMEMRSQYKDMFFEKHGVKLGFMSAFVKASVYALQDIPAVNAVIDDDEIVYRDFVDVSFAVATPKGLVVPVLRDCDKLTFAGIEKTIVDLGKRAREGTISIDQMAGGTFTISNGGVYGSLLSTPIINPPQSAILGMHAIQKRPMVIGKDIIARPMMYVTLTYDHRLIDGREAVTFLRRIKDLVEDPRRFLIDV